MWFKIAFIACFVYAVWVAATTAKRATRHHGGTINQLAHELRGLIAVRAALGFVFYAALMAWLVWPRALAWSYLAVPMAVRWLAVGLLIPTLALFTMSFRALGTNYRGGVGLYERHELVTTGPYRHVRHPIYIAFIAIMLLLAPLSTNWVLGLSGLLLVTSIAVARIPVEERELRERFGARWDAYEDQTRRVLPRTLR